MQKTSVSQNSKYLEQLTWLRGIAAFFVIVSHTRRATEVSYTAMDQTTDFLLLTLLDLGTFGVILFFVLSGCTLYISNSEKIGFNYLGHFYTKRFFRIWPAFLVALIGYIVFSFIFREFYPEPKGLWVENQFLSEYTLPDIVAYLTLTFNITGPSGLFNNAFWSLPVEFQYYLIFPLIVVTLRYTGIIGPILLSVILYFSPNLEIINFDKNNVFSLAFSFCGGVIIGHIYKKYTFRLHAIPGIIIILSLIFLASAISNSLIGLPDFPIISNIWNWFGAIGIATVFFSLITNFEFHNKVEEFLQHYGTISYSTYLYHNLFVAISVLLMIHLQINDGLARIGITFSITLIATYFLATYSYKYIEQPFITIGRNILKKDKNR